MDLVQWRSHIKQVVEDEGQWLGILNEDGLPFYELGQVSRVSFPETRLAASSVEVAVNVTLGDRVVDDLVGEGLGKTSDEGRLVPATGALRMLCLIRRGGERRVAYVTHTVAEGRYAPSVLTIHGLDLVDGLAAWPCPSIPVEWAGKEFKTWDTDASGIAYSKPRVLAQVPFATKADGYTVKGSARDTIRRLIQDSFDGVNALYGWGDDPHAVVEFDSSVDNSGQVLIRVNDDPVLETVAEPARSAGLGIEVSLWWPGDTPVRVRVSRDPEQFEVRSWAHPVQVVRIRRIKEK
ncbi:hypothetical protein [Corynebacterium sp. KPL3806]|uniref:hypothetical protein n=1 Tax=unclassified Corynebacterium TaxID=2624378 RepID=UPI0032EEF762